MQESGSYLEALGCCTHHGRCSLAHSAPTSRPHGLHHHFSSRGYGTAAKMFGQHRVQCDLPGCTLTDYTCLSAQGLYREDLLEIPVSWLSHERSALSFPWSAVQAICDKHL